LTTFKKNMAPSHPIRLVAAAAAFSLPALALATNGYFSNGYGAASQGAGGVGIALPQDGLAAANNPAGTALLASRLDLGLTWFVPNRSADIVGNAFGADAHYSGDGKKNFFIPDIGYLRQLSPTLSTGFAVYGNGGLNTRYPVNPFSRFGATGTAGVNLEQLFISPSLAWRVTTAQTLGVAITLARQRFDARGVGLFAGFSSAPAHVSDQGVDSSTGAGIRLGWQGELAPGLVAGATWASKVNGKFKKYSGLFADGGGFDIPSSYGVGLAWQATPAWNLAADVQTIQYNGVASVGNSVAKLFAGSPLGAANGPGFGWRNVTVAKFGVNYRVDNSLTLRAGFAHNRQPVPAGETFFNILAPGVVQDHFTLGSTVKVGDGEWTGFFAYAPGKAVNGAGSIPPGNPPGGFGGGNANVRLKETLIGIAYGWKL
jgi:long-chain fatty acid transport protein